MADKDLNIQIALRLNDAAGAILAKAELEKVRVAEGVLALDREKFAKQGADAKIREEKRASTELVRTGKTVLTEEQIQAQARERLTRELNRVRTEQAMSTMRTEVSATETAASSLAAFARGFGALSVARQIVRTIVDAFDEVITKEKAAAQGFIEYRKTLGAVGALQGRPGADRRTALEQIDLQRVTGATGAEAATFSEEFLGAGQAAIGKTISEKDSKELVKRALPFGLATGLEPEIVGKFAGMTALTSPKPLNADQAMQSLLQVKQLADPGAAKNKEIYRQISNLMGGLVKTGQMSLPELAGSMSVLSMAGEGDIQTHMQQLSRVLNMGGMRERDRMKHEHPEQFEAMAKLWQKAGINDHDRIFAREKKLIGLISREEAGAKARGEDFNLPIWLQHHGFAGRQQDVEAVMALYGGRDLLGSMMPHIARGPSLAATKQFEASLAGNDVMRERRSRASLSTAEQLRGFQMAEGEAVDEAAQGAILGAGTDINPVARQHDALQNLIGLHAPGSDFAQQQRRQHLINMMARQLQAKAGFSDEQLSSLGVEPRTFEEDRRTTHENRMTPGQNARLVEAFRQKGVDFTGEFIQALSRVETELKKQTAIAEKQGNAPLPAAPPAGMPLR